MQDKTPPHGGVLVIGSSLTYAATCPYGGSVETSSLNERFRPMGQISSAHPAAERLAVHAAMEAVTAEGAVDAPDFLDHLREIVRYAARCPEPAEGFTLISLEAPGGPFAGHAEGVGDVRIEDKTPRDFVERRVGGAEPDRVGGYRMARSSPVCISFYAFGSVIDAAVDPLRSPPRFRIVYDQQTLEPTGLYVSAWTIALRIPLVAIAVLLFIPRTRTLWGPPTEFNGELFVKIHRRW